MMMKTQKASFQDVTIGLALMEDCIQFFENWHGSEKVGENRSCRDTRGKATEEGR
jgi:hypothetical protein